MAPGLSSLLWFIAILALIPAVLWLLKRSPMGATAAHGVMRTVAQLPLGPNQRLLTVEVGSGDERRWLVLGVTGQSITTLHQMAPQADAPSAGLPQSTPFAQLMARMSQQGGASRTGHQGDGGAV